MFWFGAQFNLASLLGLTGREEASVDIMKSVEYGLKNNHLAAGEWNQSFNAQLKTQTLLIEPGKDTPRFPPYLRYKSCWEYLVRIIGLQMDEDYFYIKPFKTFNFSLKNCELAGTNFTITVKQGWNKVKVNGKIINGEAKIDRSQKAITMDFIKECR